MFPYNVFDAISAIDPTCFAFALAFILLDVITGVIKGAATAGQEGGGLSSEKMKQGFWHKLAIITALIVAALLDTAAATGLELGFEVPLFEGACVYVVLMELFSILENIAVINPELAGSRIFDLFENRPHNDGGAE